ncbi:5-hydroxytryptamine receptor 2B [Callorhinchus milii]|uniref:5-hydroxytryptamine receptor 2B n=1 Tax=Callorhinchus milii TaxID=7868 RepID=A0A4W3I1S3_CALMI|nr:5-hydroxytryptamine receptor 2B [Callorhinchus milii]|eukprot:gi/632934135/ref/XP_007900730.1/ PREDICTED: 5-hydroxytryptamine receptor 2B [Callorhinchus milii]
MLPDPLESPKPTRGTSISLQNTMSGSAGNILSNPPDSTSMLAIDRMQESLIQPFNTSGINTTLYLTITEESKFPSLLDSGFLKGEQLHKNGLQWAALLILMIIIPTIGGNILVILAVSLEKKLQNATNYFLMSLAAADMLVGLLVMPVALLNILFNSEWVLPSELCPIWIFLDILLSTASIMHLCAISLDRYIAIKKPIHHSRFNSRAKVLIKITVVWLISIGIAVSIPIKGLQDKTNTFMNKSCILKIDKFKDFIIYGSMAAFFIPLAIMIVIYFLTIQVLRKKAYLIKAKPPQHFNWATVSTVFQSNTSPEKVAMLNGSHKDRTLSLSTDDMPIRRLSTLGKKSMQSISNEQRASKVLGIVFLLFLVMWCPFFVTNVTSVLCKSCDPELIGTLMEIFVWVGYVSSGVNPLVYTLFNKTFRQAFQHYITCNYARNKPVKMLRKCSSRISFRTSMNENSRFFMRHNGLNPMYPSPLRLRSAPIQTTSSVMLDTLLLAENEMEKAEEAVSYV